MPANGSDRTDSGAPREHRASGADLERADHNGKRVVTRRAALAGSAAAGALFADAVLTGPSPAQARPLPANNAPPNTSTFYPEDYGAVGDGTTDDTAAIQACIDAVFAANGGTIQFGPKTYLVNGGSNGGPRHDRGGNAILALPNYVQQTTLRLQGVEGLTTIKSTLGGQSYSATYGCPSVIGGPTPEQLGKGNFSYWNVEVADINVQVNANPTLCGVDLTRFVRASAERVFITTTDPFTAPSSVYCFGLRMPGGLNFGRTTVSDVDISGFYFGLVLSTAHTRIDKVLVKWCQSGLGLAGSSQYDNVDPHGTVIEMLSTEWCFTHICGYTTSGAISLPAGVPIHLICQLWDIEDAPSSNWYSTFAHLFDANNQVYGHANYVHIKANVGVQHGPLIVSGGTNLGLAEISRTGGVSAPAGAATRTAPPTPNSREAPRVPRTVHSRPNGPLPERVFRDRVRKQARP